ncbi:HAMP domain-containing sensor histidine kinase [Nonomuraea longicatena]|uniref:histidine kinase n=1 Tax=Nonomuraea longicatena TaxID=83682 RepID=A0ABN1P2Q6_9ACTN
MSLRMRSSLIAGSIAALISLVLCTGLLVQGYWTRVETTKDGIATSARRIALVMSRDQLSSPIPTVSGQSVQVINDHGQVTASTADVAGQPPFTGHLPPTDDFRWDGVIERDGEEFLVVGVRAGLEPLAPQTVYVTTAMPKLLTYDPQFLLTLAGISIFSVGAVMALTWYMVSRALRPVAAIRDELCEITATDLHRRVPEPSRDDEIATLARTVNATLDRLDEALSQQRSFVADASHELRSPITCLRAEVDLALMEASEDCPQRAPLEAVDRAADRLQILVADLLAVARMDAGMAPKAEPVNLRDLVLDEVARRHPDKTVRTSLATGVVVEGDRLQLARVLVNLLDNALRHARSTVDIVVRADRDHGVLEVNDDGAGLAPEDRERVFKRFARLAEGRTRDPGGSGLGLPIAREIAARHGGTLQVEEGSRLVMRIPLLSRQAVPKRSGNRQIA